MTKVAAPRVPIVMPLVEVSFDDDGAGQVVVDRAPYNHNGGVSREDLDVVIHELAASLGPIRVELTEADGTRFIDIVLAQPDHRAQAEDPRESSSALAGDGFVPDEDVALAVILTRHRADADGRVRVRLPPAALRTSGGGVALLGRTSGRYVVCETP